MNRFKDTTPAVIVKQGGGVVMCYSVKYQMCFVVIHDVRHALPWLVFITMLKNVEHEYTAK